MTKFYMSPTVEDEDAHNEYFHNNTKVRESGDGRPSYRVRSCLLCVLLEALKKHQTDIRERVSRQLRAQTISRWQIVPCLPLVKNTPRGSERDLWKMN